MNSILKNLTSNWKLVTIVAAAAFVVGLMLRPAPPKQTHTSESGSSTTIWTCSMHPQIRQPEPGDCPICAMDLIPLVEDEGSADLSERQLKLSPNAIKLAQVQTSAVERKSVANPLSLYGKIAVDETRKKTITAWAPGRIEKLFVDYTGADVKRGEPLVEIYSPELFVAQQEYLNAIKDSSALLNLDAIKKKFELWGISKAQLDEIEQRGTATERMIIYAPIAGIVLMKNVIEGQYVKTGSPLYDIADLSSVWIYLDAYEQDLPRLKKGNSISFTAQAVPGQTFQGTIDFVEPVLDSRSRTVKIRAMAQNVNKTLKPGVLVSATIQTSSQSGLVVPASAVLLTGERAVVYVAVPEKEGVFEGREIIVGERSGDYFVVKHGLRQGETVVTNGAFKIDSEMQLLAKKSMMSPAAHDEPGHDHIDNRANMDADQRSSKTTAPSHADHADMSQESHSTLEITDEFRKSLDPIYLAYYVIQDQLAHDKSDNLAAPANNLINAVNKVDASGAGVHASHWQKLGKTIQTASELIGASNNISIARAEFKKLSDALIETVAVFGSSGDLVVRQYHCPMAFNDTGADWLSPKDDVENPYFGADMFSCGWRVKTFSEPEGGANE